jgi:hypothetical protein
LSFPHVNSQYIQWGLRVHSNFGILNGCMPLARKQPGSSGIPNIGLPLRTCGKAIRCAEKIPNQNRRRNAANGSKPPVQAVPATGRWNTQALGPVEGVRQRLVRKSLRADRLYALAERSFQFLVRRVVAAPGEIATHFKSLHTNLFDQPEAQARDNSSLACASGW